MSLQANQSRPLDLSGGSDQGGTWAKHFSAVVSHGEGPDLEADTDLEIVNKLDP